MPKKPKKNKYIRLVIMLPKTEANMQSIQKVAGFAMAQPYQVYDHPTGSVIVKTETVMIDDAMTARYPAKS